MMNVQEERITLFLLYSNGGRDYDMGDRDDHDDVLLMMISL